MRLLVEILIIAAVIYVGWNKPYKEYVARANSTDNVQTRWSRRELTKTRGLLCEEIPGQAVNSCERQFCPGLSVVSPALQANQLSARLLPHSTTSSSCLPSTVPSSRSSAIWSQYRFSPWTMNFAGSVRFAVPGAYFPVCAITSIIRFQVRLCPTSASARANTCFFSSAAAKAGSAATAAKASGETSARVNAGPCPNTYVRSLKWLALREASNFETESPLRVRENAVSLSSARIMKR